MRTRGNVVMTALGVSEVGDALDPVRSAFETAVQLLEADRASLLLRSPGEDVLLVHSSVGLDPEIASSVRVVAGEGVAGLVAELGQPLLGHVGSETFLSVPVRPEGRIEGVLSVTDRHGDRPYGVRDMALASKAASHIGRLIEYGRYAARDPVSDLHNRRSFEEMLEREVARTRRTGTTFGVIFFDVDNLKIINDRFGHQTGDEVIFAIGKITRENLRPYDFAARYGGDEFVALLSSMPEEEIAETTEAIARRITAAVDDLAASRGMPISISMGTACWPADGTTSTEVVAAADRRMYQSKRSKQARSKRLSL